MNYDEMSDYELSCEIMYAIHGEHIKNWCLSDCETYIYDCGPIGEDFHKIPVFDINNHADMWPIIESIWWELLKCDEYGVTEWARHMRKDDFSDKLRAAAIVFLIMKGVKPDERI